MNEYVAAFTVIWRTAVFDMTTAARRGDRAAASNFEAVLNSLIIAYPQLAEVVLNAKDA